MVRDGDGLYCFWIRKGTRGERVPMSWASGLLKARLAPGKDTFQMDFLFPSGGVEQKGVGAVETWRWRRGFGLGIRIGDPAYIGDGGDGCAGRVRSRSFIPAAFHVLSPCTPLLWMRA